jgi:cytochrome b561
MDFAIVGPFVVAAVVLNTPKGATTAGFTQGTLHHWHESVGPIALAAALVHLARRRAMSLPDRAPNLGDAERRWIVRVEAVLYLCLLALPVGGAST